MGNFRGTGVSLKCTLREIGYVRLVLRRGKGYAHAMRHIGISLRFEDSFDHAVARGIIRYAKGRPDWSLHGSGSGFRPLRFSDMDALIVRVENVLDAQRIASLGIPVVDIAGAHPIQRFHRVQNDDFLTGRLAGGYLRRLGATRYAFCGVEQVFWSRRRLLGFSEAASVPVDRIGIFDRSLPWWHDREESASLSAWLKELKAPVALLCCNDIAGVKVSEHCRAAGLAIPDDITLLGVDNEDLLCELSTPSLSSVRLDCRGIGYKAAELLDRILCSPEEVPRGTLLRIPPCGIVERESTTAVLEEDPQVARALRYIRENATGGIGAADVVADCTVSRRTLEQCVV